MKKTYKKIVGIEFKKGNKWYRQNIKGLKNWKNDARTLAKKNPKTIKIIKRK